LRPSGSVEERERLAERRKAGTDPINLGGHRYDTSQS